MLACLIDAVRAGAHPVVAFSGFCESHEPPPLGDVLSTRIMMAIETASKVGTFCINILLIVTLAAARGIRSE